MRWAQINNDNNSLAQIKAFHDADELKKICLEYSSGAKNRNIKVQRMKKYTSRKKEPKKDVVMLGNNISDALMVVNIKITATIYFMRLPCYSKSLQLFFVGHSMNGELTTCSAKSKQEHAARIPQPKN